MPIHFSRTRPVGFSQSTSTRARGKKTSSRLPRPAAPSALPWQSSAHAPGTAHTPGFSSRRRSPQARAESNDYDAELGREDYDTLGATLQWEWQVSPTSSASAYYGYDRSTLNLANVNEGELTSDPALGGPTYPLGARWWVEDAQRKHYFGATLNQQLGRVRLELAGNYTESRGTTDLTGC